MHSLNNTVELHLSRIIGMASHLDMQKIQIIGFFFEWATLAVGGSAVNCLQYVLVSTPFDHA
jgi:hypothetical protein